MLADVQANSNLAAAWGSWWVGPHVCPRHRSRRLKSRPVPQPPGGTSHLAEERGVDPLCPAGEALLQLCIHQLQTVHSTVVPVFLVSRDRKYEKQQGILESVAILWCIDLNSILCSSLDCDCHKRDCENRLLLAEEYPDNHAHACL